MPKKTVVASKKPARAAKTAAAARTWLIIDQDDFMAETRAREKIDAFLPAEAQSLGLEILPGAAATVAEAQTVLRNLQAGLSAGSLFAERRAIWWRNATLLANGVILRNKEVNQLMQEIAALAAEGLPEGLLLVITAPAVPEKWPLAKACKSAGSLLQAKEVKPWNRDAPAVEFAARALRQAGLTCDREATAALVARVGTDTRTLQQEIAKLDVYLGRRRTATVADIEDVISPGRDFFVWDLEDAVSDRELLKALDILRRLLFQKEEPIRLVNSLDTRFRNLMILAEALRQGWLRPPNPNSRFSGGQKLPPQLEEVFAADRRMLNAYMRDMLLKRAANFTVAELAEARRLILDVRKQLVSSGSLPANLLLEQLIIRLCRQPETRQPHGASTPARRAAARS